MKERKLFLIKYSYHINASTFYAKDIKLIHPNS